MERTEGDEEMSRLIDADEILINGIKNKTIEISYEDLLGDLEKIFTLLFKDVRALIDEQPTIDAVPVVHGRWIGWSGEKMVDYYNETYKKIHGYRCSNCNRNTAVKSKYCSCCGALMDEVTE